MTPLFASARRGLFVILGFVAIAELMATILVAQSLHHPFVPGSSLTLASATVAAFVLQIVQRRLSEAVGLSYTAAVRSALFRHLMTVHPEIIRARKHGAMLQSFVGDLTALRQWVSDGVVRGVLAIIALFGMLSWVAYSRPQLALYLLAITLVVAAAGAALLPALRAAVITVRRERGRVAAFASERLSAQSAILAFGRVGSEAAKLNRRVDRLNRASLRRAWFTGALRALPHFATTLMLAAVVLVGPHGTGRLAGNVVIIGILGLALRDLARAGELMIPGHVSTARIVRLLDLPTRKRAPRRGADNANEKGLVIENFGMDNHGPGWSARADRGDIILLTGAPEVRSQFFASLFGLSCPARGSIRWDGVEMVGLGTYRLRKLLGVASPDLPLLAASTSRNIRYRATQLRDEEVKLLADFWNVDLEKKPLNEQRTSLLRAIAGSPPLLLLDLAATPLQDEDLRRLILTIRGWPGVVLMTSEQITLQQAATRIWKLSPEGFSEICIEDEGALRLVNNVPAVPA